MTVGELKQLLSEAPDDMPVMLLVENHLKPGMLAFAPPCPGETGISELGEDEHGTGGGESVFLIMRHGATVSEEEAENGEVPELN